MNREFLALANDFEPENHYVRGMFMSEKLDGHRCFWDGGISAGYEVSQVPWANRDAYGRSFISSGLWSRYGHPFHAPAWFTASLPRNIPLDGELFVGRKQFEATGFIKGHDSGDPRWKNVKFHVFGGPTYEQVLQPGTINNPNFQKEFTPALMEFIHKEFKGRFAYHFDQVYKFLQGLNLGPNAQLVEQVKLPSDEEEAMAIVMAKLDEIVALNGEGLILADPYAVWNPRRTNNLLKIKPLKDAEATVIGYSSGKITKKGSRLRGLLGALVVEWNGIVFEVASGLTDSMRRLSDYTYAYTHPGEQMPDTIVSETFPRGTKITFKYTELTNAGVPRNARFYRKWEA